MFKSCSLVLVSILAVAMLAPPASSQGQKVTLEIVATDVINLQSFVKEMQRTADTRNAETKALLEQMNTRFSSIDSNLQKLGTSLEAVKAADERSYKELQDARTTLNSMKTTMDTLNTLGEGLQEIRNGIYGKGGLKEMIRDMQVTEVSSGPTDRQAYDSAYSLFTQGFYDDAIAEFRDLVKAYPRSARAPKALLHVGMAYASQKKFEQAVVAYDEAIQTYPESDTKCTALYKKGLSLSELNKAPEARQVFTAVTKECPNSDEAPLAAAALKRLPAGRGSRGN
jgi:tol-pal system protein YbgF